MRQVSYRTRVSLTSLGVALLVLSARADVVLNPGKVTGSSGLTSWTFAGGSVGLSQSPGTFSGSTSISGAPGAAYTVTVEGNQTYQYLYESLSLGNTYFSMSRSLPAPGLFVPANQTVAGQDLNTPGGTIRVNFSATTAPGATATSFSHYIFADTPSATESYYASDYTYGNPFVDLPMAANAGDVHVYGSVYYSLTDANGTCTVSEYLSLTVATPSEGNVTVANDIFDLSNASCPKTGVGTIKGRVALNAQPIPPASAIVCISGGTGGACSPITSNPFDYQFDNLSAGADGNHNVTAYETWGSTNSVWSFLRLSPNGGQDYVSLQPGDIATRDFIYDATGVQGTFTVNGPLASRLANTSNPSAYFGFQPASNDPAAPNYQTQAFTYLPSPLTSPATSFAHGLTAGSWRQTHFSAGVYDNNENLYISLYDGGSPPIDLTTAGQTYTYNRTVETSQGDLVFDVDEHGGATVGISYPGVSINRWDEGTQQYVSISVQSYAVNQATPVVHVIGPPGQYPFSAFAQVTNPDGSASWVTFPAGEINLGQGANTPPGTNEQVTLLDPNGVPIGITLTFSNVTAGGESTASTVSQGPPPPGGFTLIPAFNGLTFASISTTATFTGPVKVAIRYDPATQGLNASTEPFLTLWHYKCPTPNTCSWQNITDYSLGPGNNPNLVTHTIYGVTDSFSIFALGLPSGSGQPPSVACVGTQSSRSLVSASNSCVAPVDNNNGVGGSCSGGGGGLASCTFNGQSSLSLLPGPYSIDVKGTAKDGSSAQCTSYNEVVDTTAPSLTVTASPSVLWPANHKLIPIQVNTIASDSCDASPVLSCAVTSNEPVNSTGDGNTTGDIVWSKGQLFLRAERKGNAADRVYTIACTATDSSRNTTAATATVIVPHDKR